MEYYTLIKGIHILTVAVSGTLFALRAGLRIHALGKGKDPTQRPWLRIAPHVNDTVLLSCAGSRASASMVFHCRARASSARACSAALSAQQSAGTCADRADHNPILTAQHSKGDIGRPPAACRTSTCGRPTARAQRRNPTTS